MHNKEPTKRVVQNVRSVGMGWQVGVVRSERGVIPCANQEPWVGWGSVLPAGVANTSRGTITANRAEGRWGTVSALCK